VLSTYSGHEVSSRVVLIRIINHRGFIFFTNLNSKKATEIQHNPCVALNFYFREQCRQIIIQGKAEMLDENIADEYFAQRSREKQISAWASLQSQVMLHEDDFTSRLQNAASRFANKTIPRPEFWSGYIIIPHSFEFWKEGVARRHERSCYKKTHDDKWTNYRLYP
jgi:pyridoxamine 5'-phosphate oxidase